MSSGENWWKDLSDFFYRHEVAGLLGAAVSLRWTLYGSNPLERLWNLLSAWVAAVYLTDPLVSWLGLSSIRGATYGLAFLVGLFSLNLMASIVELLKSGKVFDLLPWGKK